MKTLVLTDEEFATLETLFDCEWQQEWQFQVDGDKDTHWLERYFEVYKKMVNAKYSQGIERFVAKDLIDRKQKEIEEVRK